LQTLFTHFCERQSAATVQGDPVCPLWQLALTQILSVQSAELLHGDPTLPSSQWE
jgi:hypothetical protein